MDFLIMTQRWWLPMMENADIADKDTVSDRIAANQAEVCKRARELVQHEDLVPVKTVILMFRKT